MNTKKKYLVTGAVIGGLLLAATMHSANTFALSDTSSDPNTSTTTPATTTDPTSTPSSVADGSTATQTANTGDTTSSSTDTTTAPTTDPDSSTDPSDTTTPSNAPADPSTSPSNPSSTTTSNANTTAVDNTVTGTAQTGDATVTDNNHAGNATTGNASSVTNLINTIASSSSLASGGLQTFTYNINGNQNGDIILNPNDLLTGAGSTPAGSVSVNSANDSSITNNVNLSATSGDAAVADNRVGGNATSGDATTEANIINLIDSLISDGQSFLGVININGNLNGNILIPSSLIDSLLGGSTLTTPAGTTSSTNNTAINNNVSLTAQSGTATVANNGVGGNATSGNATTALSIYNLTNSQIVGGNVLLVFVNVMGHWVGLLMDAPAGTTSAAFGGSIQQDKQDTPVPISDIITSNTSTITNNVTLASTTGNATVSGNHRGGNATTGNAIATADIVNILGSQINLTGWLGVLIINVFGTWNGNLAVQPAATTSGTTGHTGGHKPGHHHGTTARSSGDGFAYYIAYPPQSDQIVAASAHILGDSVSKHIVGPSTNHIALTSQSDHSGKGVFVDFILAGIGLLVAAAIGTTRFLHLRRHKA